MDPISSIRPLPSPEFRIPQWPKLESSPELKQLGQAAPAGAAKPEGTSFPNLLDRLVSEVNGKQIAAGDAVNGLLSGEKVPLHQAMIAMQEAGVAFRLMVEVRNKLLEGYQELMRMQI